MYLSVWPIGSWCVYVLVCANLMPLRSIRAEARGLKALASSTLYDNDQLIFIELTAWIKSVTRTRERNNGPTAKTSLYMTSVRTTIRSTILQATHNRKTCVSDSEAMFDVSIRTMCLSCSIVERWTSPEVLLCMFESVEDETGRCRSKLTI